MYMKTCYFIKCMNNVGKGRSVKKAWVAISMIHIEGWIDHFNSKRGHFSFTTYSYKSLGICNAGFLNVHYIVSNVIYFNIYIVRISLHYIPAPSYFIIPCKTILYIFIITAQKCAALF